MEDVKGVTDEALKAHGIVPGKKEEGVTRAIHENPNGFNSQINCNEKLEKAKEIIDELEADVVAYSEHRLNCKHKDNINGFSQMFRDREADIISVAAHNVHENVGIIKEGGTSMLLYGSLLDRYNFEHSGKDNTGIGRWVVMVFQGYKGIKTRIVCGDKSCHNKKMESRTSYHKKHRYLVLKEKDLTFPMKRLHGDLIRQLKDWREEGDRIILCMDAKEVIRKRALKNT